MKRKRFLAIACCAAMAVSMTACGGSEIESTGDASTSGNEGAGESTGTNTGSAEQASSDFINYADLKIGEDLTDLTASIHLFNHRTDMNGDDYTGKTWKDYLEEFHKDYPNIQVEVETDTDYAESALLRLQSGDWGDIMMIPAVDAADLDTYFLPYGDVDTMEQQVRFPSQFAYKNITYGVPSTGNAQGIVYNKKVFEEAGITTLPKTPEEFQEALKKIKENTEAIPLYTNYAAGWTMGAWDAYIGGTATGRSSYYNQELAHTKNPMADPGDGTGPYNVYKVLYDAVANGYTEDDFTTTDWEGCKGMINNGQIGCMVLGSWAYSQMVDAGEHGDDIGYMSFPITVDGKQYASAGPDYCYGINAASDVTNQQAALIFVKWMTEKSGFAYNEGGIPIAADDDNYPELYSAFEGIEFVADDPAMEGQEDLLNTLNADSELNFNNGGDSKVQGIVEHAANGDESFDEIMEEWNEAWTDAQETNDVSISE